MLDVRIDDSAIVKHGITTGDHVTIDAFVYCSVRLQTGSWVHVAPHVSIIGGKRSSLYIGDFAGVSTGARIICGSEDFINSLCGFVPEEYRTTIYGRTTLEDFSWVGAGAILLPNITMAEGSVAGAGAVITKDTEPWGVYVGNPAKMIKIRDKHNIIKNALNLKNENTTR